MTENHLQIFEPELGVGPGPEWLAEAMDDYRIHVLQQAYPCNFGRRSLEKRELYMTWVDPDRPDTLPGDVAEFMEITQTDRLGREPLAIRPWPEDIPEEPDEEGWMFSFHGVEMFVFALVPTHRLRRSRYAGPALVIMLLPKSVFVGVEVGTPAGNAARLGIRKRLAEWDQPIEFHPSVGVYDVMSTEEWRQYFLTEDSSDMHETCPLAHHGARVMQEQT